MIGTCGAGAVVEDGKKKKSYIFMVRTKIPGGKLTSRHILDELDLCDEVCNTTLRITSRQGLQLPRRAEIESQTVDSPHKRGPTLHFGACGDVNRNVMCCPAPYKNKRLSPTQEAGRQAAEHFAPKNQVLSRAWLTDSATGDKQLAGGATEGDGFDVETDLRQVLHAAEVQDGHRLCI